MNPSSIAQHLNSKPPVICFRHALHCVLEGTLALSLYGMRMRRYNGENFKPVLVPQATLPNAGKAAADIIKLHE